MLWTDSIGSAASLRTVRQEPTDHPFIGRLLSRLSITIVAKTGRTAPTDSRFDSQAERTERIIVDVTALTDEAFLSQRTTAALGGRHWANS